MENVKVNDDMLVLITELTGLEQNKLMLLAAIYTRKVQEIKANKIEKFRKYLLDEVSFYKRNLNKYSSQIDVYVEMYEKKIDEVIEQYEILYKYLQNEIAFAQTNQKIAVANFVASKRGLDKATSDNNIALIEKSNKKVFATAQKKLNYDVVIDQCTDKLKACIDDTIEAIDDIFAISSDKLLINPKGLIDKIKYNFMITFNGKKSFERNVILPLEIKLKSIRKTVMETIAETKFEIIACTSQLEKIRNDINCSFNETLNKVS